MGLKLQYNTTDLTGHHEAVLAFLHLNETIQKANKVDFGAQAESTSKILFFIKNGRLDLLGY